MRRVALLAAIALAALPAAAAAQSCPKTSVADVEDEVMCPVCGTPLAVASEAPQAERERAFIQRLVDDCRSKDEVKQALVAEFGDRVLALPGDQGDDSLGDVLVYVVPALGILLAAGGVAFAVVRWRRRGGGPGGRRGTAVAGADGSRLEDDMERYEL